MICLICRQTQTVERLASIKFERGDFKLDVRAVPARVCPGCGEAYVDEDVAVRLLYYAEKTSKAGMDAVIHYNNFT